MPNPRRQQRTLRRRAHRLSRRRPDPPLVQQVAHRQLQQLRAQASHSDHLSDLDPDDAWTYEPQEGSLSDLTTRAAQAAIQSARRCPTCGPHHSHRHCTGPHPPVRPHLNILRSRRDSGNSSTEEDREVHNILRGRDTPPREPTPPLLLIERAHRADCICIECRLPNVTVTTRFDNLSLLRQLDSLEEDTQRQFLTNAFDPIFDRAIDLGLLRPPQSYSPPTPAHPTPYSPEPIPDLLPLHIETFPDIVASTHTGGHLRFDFNLRPTTPEDTVNTPDLPPPLIDLPADTESD